MAELDTGLVRFVCTAAEHSRGQPDSDGGMLTIHQGLWGFCPSGRTDGHLWEAIDGVSIAALRAQMRGRGNLDIARTKSTVARP